MISIGPSKTLLKRNLEKQQFQGIIQNKIIDKDDHFANKIIINGQSQPIHWKLYIELNVGDSVNKFKNEPYITIFKKDGQKIKYDLLNNKIND